MRKIAVAVLLLTLIISSGCIRIDGPYRGKVIDAETNLPIQGAVVHGTWHKIHLGGGSDYYDSYETLTDKNGEFKIPGQGLLFDTFILGHVDWVMLTIFKAGYEEVEPSWWKGLRGGSYKVVTWQGDKGIFRLKRMTLEQRRKRVITFPNVPNNKERLFELESNKENIEIGSDANTLFDVR